MIEESYTLFGRIPLFRDAKGIYATDPLWQRDLALHFGYIRDFRICCPVRQVEAIPDGQAVVEGLADENVTAIREDFGWFSVLRNFIPNGRQVWRALRKTKIAHSGGAGWSFPISYYLLAFRPFLRFQWVMLIESSFYRVAKGQRAGLRRRLGHYFHSALVRSCVRSADARVFTSQAYRDLFLGSSQKSLIAPAIWVNSSDVVSDESLPDSAGPGQARFIFPARLEPEKGVSVVMDAIRHLKEIRDSAGAPMPRIDMMGSGSLVESCREFVRELDDPRVRFRESVPYGEPFFSALREYDAVLVANLQDEQPRIIFDAFSQAVPCISSRTGGTHDLMEEGRTGLFFDRGDPLALARLIDQASEDKETFRRMGLAARKSVMNQTHEAMHEARRKFLIEALALRQVQGEGR